MGIKVANNAFATLAAGISDSDTSITVSTGQGARFPALGAGDYFYATLINTSNQLEIVQCTARSTDVLTVVRAQEATAARAYEVGDRIEIRITAQTFADATSNAENFAYTGTLTGGTGVVNLGSGQVYKDASGNVGIGTSSPGTKLHIQGDHVSNSGLLRLNANSGQRYATLSLWNDTTAKGFLTHDNTDNSIDLYASSGQQLRFFTNDAERLRITSAGNVGIGTTSPDLKTHIQDGALSGRSAANSNCDLVIEGTNNTGIQFFSGTQTQLRFGDDASTGSGSIIYTHSDDQLRLIATSILRFDAGGSERMRIDSAGNVGIGTSSPATALHVVGVSRTQRIGSANAYEWYVSSGNTLFLTNIVNATEPFRVTSAGDLQFNSGFGSAATAYGCRAWVNFNGTGTVAIRASGNVSSITDNGTGNYTVNFTTAMPDANYSACGSSQDNNSTGTSSFTSYSRTASSIVVVCSTIGTDTLFNTEVMNVAIFR